jgi:hypothetical protein
MARLRHQNHIELLQGTLDLPILRGGAPPEDALTYAAVAAIVLAIALAACLLPAQRALRVNLADAFRAE